MGRHLLVAVGWLVVRGPCHVCSDAVEQPREAVLERVEVTRWVGSRSPAGIVDRFRSLPMAHSSVLAGRVLADTLVSVLTLGVMVAVGYLVGFRITTSVVAALGAFVVIMAFAFAFSWIAAWIGLTLKEPEAVQSAGLVWLFPLAFASGVFVVPATLPGWLQGFAAHNPLTRVSDAARALTIGEYPCGASIETVTACTGVQTNLLWSLAWAVAIFAVFLPLSVRGWKRLD